MCIDQLHRPPFQPRSQVLSPTQNLTKEGVDEGRHISEKPEVVTIERSVGIEWSLSPDDV